MEEILRHAAILGVVAALFLLTAFMDPQMTGFTVSYDAGNSNLTIWDETDPEGGDEFRYTCPTNSLAYSGCNDFKKISTTDWNVYFFSNYTNSTNDPIDNLTSNCEIRFNKTGTWTIWENMTFNITSSLWEYNTSFTYKGVRDWEVNCTGIYDNITLKDDNGVTITNSEPCIFSRQTEGGPLQNLSCTEEVTCDYYLNLNSTDDDMNDLPIYDHAANGWDDTYMTLDSAGHFTILITSNDDPDNFNVTFIVTDTDSSSDAAYMLINENYTNDAPIFSTLPDEATEDVEFNETNNPESVITATDEEDNTPFVFNLTFLSCQKARWIEYPTSNCTLFNFTASGTNITIHNFTPTNWDVGMYQINFTVEDNGTGQFGYNATDNTTVWFNVTNVNDYPVITPWNGTEIELNQGQQMYILFNGTDIENDTLIFNATTLLWNESNQSYYAYTNASLFSIATNNTYYPNESAYGIMDFVLINDHVGNYTVNITVTDNGTGTYENLTSYMLVNLTILNVNDPPVLENITDTLPGAVQEMPYYYYFNASDPDMLTIYGDNLIFAFNFTECMTLNGTENCNEFGQNSTFSISKISNTTAEFYVYAVRNDSGNYTLNLTVTDDDGLMNWSIVNLTIQPDEAPIINAVTLLTGTQNQTLFYYFNITDPENDTLNITNVTLYRNLSVAHAHFFPVSLNSSGYPPAYNVTMNYTNLTNAQVGNYTLEINATDIWNRTTTHLINISVENINDPPVIINWTNCDDDTTYILNATLSENIYYCIMLTNPDPDLLVPKETYWENLTYTMNEMYCSSDTDYCPSGNCSGFGPGGIDIDYDDGWIIFTAENETWHGNYTYNLTIDDSAGSTASKIFTMEILPVNDQPVLHNINESYNITAEVMFNFTVNATDEENNTPFFYNVSFTWCDSPPCDLFIIDNATGEVNFTATNDDIGNYTANFTVRDTANASFGLPYSKNATGWELSNMSVFRQYHAPTIDHFTPWNPTPYSNMTEGTVKEFRYEANDTTDNDSLTCYWYFDDGTNITFITPDSTLPNQVENPVYDCNTTPGGELGEWFYPVTYDDALNLSQRGVAIILSVVDPQGFVVNDSVSMTVVGSNRPPRFPKTLPIQSPIKWFAGMEITPIDLDDYFVDDYGEVLKYTYTGASMVGVTINDDNTVTFSSPSWFGTDSIQFNASDPQNATNISNTVILEVEYQAPRVVDRPVTVYRPKIASMHIIVDEIIKVQTLNSSRARVVIHNDGDYNLKEINLSTFTNVTNITLGLDDEYIEGLAAGDNFTTWLNITIGDLEEGTYLAHIFADSARPAISESATLNIKVTPSNATKVIIQIIMVKDLFEENPECMELFGLIVQAEESLENDDVEEARRLTQLAMDHCQDMIDYAKLQKEEPAGLSSLVGQIFVNPFFVMGFVLALLSLAMAGYWFMSKRAASSEPKTINIEEE